MSWIIIIQNRSGENKPITTVNIEDPQEAINFGVALYSSQPRPKGIGAQLLSQRTLEEFAQKNYHFCEGGHKCSHKNRWPEEGPHFFRKN